MHDSNVANAIDDSTVISILEMETGQETRWVRGRSDEKISRTFGITAGWSQLSLVAHPTPNLTTPTRPTPVPGPWG